MIATLSFLACLLPIYVFILLTNLVGGILGVLFGITFIEELYIKLLLKVFEYAASTVSNEKVVNRRKLLDRTLSVGSYDKDLCLIDRDVRLGQDGIIINEGYIKDANNSFSLGHPSYFVKSGVEAIIEDDVTKRFSANELEVWNLLSRTHSYQHINIQLTILWGIGMFTRYVILLPCRIIIFALAILILVGGSFIIEMLPEKAGNTLNKILSRFSFRLFIRAYSGVIRFHNKNNKAVAGGICVANHTTPIDVITLGCDNSYAMVGQKQGGFFGMMQRVFGRATSTIWFERGEARDREGVSRRLKEHIAAPGTLPILIFPEGTCINNTSVMMFKKGSFEVGATMYPVAIKYDTRFSDCFWNSSKFSLLQYLFMMMSSWAIVADVWYLPAERQLATENSIQFANRVKRYIAAQGGLVDMKWDGGLKRAQPRADLKQVQQASFSRILKTSLEQQQNKTHEQSLPSFPEESKGDEQKAK